MTLPHSALCKIISLKSDVVQRVNVVFFTLFFQLENQSTLRRGIGTMRLLGRNDVQSWIRGGKQVSRAFSVMT